MSKPGLMLVAGERSGKVCGAMQARAVPTRRGNLGLRISAARR